MLRKVLIANRGEIAVRVIRACRELGVGAVAVYSDPDRLSPHVWHADEAYRIGPAAASESYLSIDRLIDVARAADCDAVHPGYGFLAENAEFADACDGAGLTFIGPAADTIALMGDKTEARRAMEAAGVPCVPGSGSPLADADAAEAACEEIGYPVLLKAAAGGGGKGMRTVFEPGEVRRAFEAARREAEGAFGDGRIYIESFVERPRHVEIQILADAHGKVVHLNERECSIQRRHQKLIEESPSPAVDPDLRERMGAAAVTAARSADYVNAGTVEFLLAPDGAFYFLEMNTRLQVEHPVTEMVSGVDLVQAQLRVAAGEELGLESVEPRGHAIECRITAEDPDAGFLPGGGRVSRLRVPAGPGVRWDAGIVQGTEVGLHYDSLLAKLIVHADDRAGAVARMARALDELLIGGVVTTRAFHRRVMEETDFRAGDIHTGYLEEHRVVTQRQPPDETTREAIAVAAAILEDRERGRVRFDRAGADGSTPSAWRWGPSGWSDPI